MPNINLIPVPQYISDQPYHYYYDNLPLDALVQRELLINSAVDINSEILRQSIGTAGTLAARLNQSLNDNGSLKTTAVDNTLHNIGYHTDGLYDGVEYVRMTLAEREKLGLVADEATNFSIGVQGPSDIIYIPEGLMLIEPSTTIEWTVLNNQKIRADVTTGLTNAHEHFDNVEPISVSATPDYKNYLTNLGAQFREGSLKVYINGVRMLSDKITYYPSATDPSGTWHTNKFTENLNSSLANYLKGFSLLNAITINDIVRIDFEVPLG
jgi:hypothetical protein